VIATFASTAARLVTGQRIARLCDATLGVAIEIPAPVRGRGLVQGLVHALVQCRDLVHGLIPVLVVTPVRHAHALQGVLVHAVIPDEEDLLLHHVLQLGKAPHPALDVRHLVPFQTVAPDRDLVQIPAHVGTSVVVTRLHHGVAVTAAVTVAVAVGAAVVAEPRPLKPEDHQAHLPPLRRRELVHPGTTASQTRRHHAVRPRPDVILTAPVQATTAIAAEAEVVADVRTVLHRALLLREHQGRDSESPRGLSSFSTSQSAS